MDDLYAISNGKGHVCLKIMFGEYEVSLVLDDSCGASPRMFRSGLRIFKGSEDVTGRFYPGVEEVYAIQPRDFSDILNKVKKAADANKETGQ